jgi:WD40 repeat protein
LITGVITGGQDHTVRVWHLLGKPKEVAVLPQGATVYQVAVAPKGALLATMGFEPSRVRLWNSVTGKLREDRKLLTPGALAGVFSPDGATLYLGTGEERPRDEEKGKAAGTLRVWDVRGDQSKETAVVEQPIALLNLAVSPDGKRLATAGGRLIVREREIKEHVGELQLWDVTGPVPKVSARLEGHLGVVYGVAFSPDGKLLASSGFDHTVRLWDVSGAKPKSLTALRGHGVAVYTVSFSPDGKLLASADHFGRVVVWDVGRRFQRIAWQLPGRVTQVDFAADGRHLATANANGTVYVFRLPAAAKK